MYFGKRPTVRSDEYKLSGKTARRKRKVDPASDIYGWTAGKFMKFVWANLLQTLSITAIKMEHT
jgi:hypothetical protein